MTTLQNDRKDPMTPTSPIITDAADRRTAQLDRYADDLMNGAVFARHAIAARSRRGYMPPIHRDAYAKAITVLAQMAGESDAMAQVARECIGRVNLYGDASQADAAIWEAAADALRVGFDDVIGRAAPDAYGPRSSFQHDFTLDQRARIACWLNAATAPFASHVPGIGWCLLALMHREGIRVPQCISTEDGSLGRVR